MASRKRTLAIVVAVAVIATVGGFLAARQVQSPAEEAAMAKAPVAGPITAAVESKTLHSQVVTRGDVVYDGALGVRVETAALSTPPIVTGHLPAVGATISEGDVMLEVTGRPVLVVGGDLPTYRTLVPGTTGPDVAQLEQALSRLGLDPGTIDETYDNHTAAAVRALFQRAGYEPPAASSDAQHDVTAAQAELAATTDAVRQAESALAAADVAIPHSEQLAADADVAAAERALADAQASADAAAIADTTSQLAIAKARRDERLAPADTSRQRQDLAAARSRRHEAEVSVTAAVTAADTPLPAAEIVYLPSLPRRVDAVAVTRGALVDGNVMTVSGATIVVHAAVDATDRALLQSGLRVTLERGAVSVAGTITSITDVAGAASTAIITPEPLDPAQLEALRSANVKVTVPFATTGGDVLCVPLAAVSAGAGGESRVELLRADGTTVLAPVDVGLTAEGFAEIHPRDVAIAAGDRVVVGR
jgi:peptidoglycan hydrolase-like protein with peptidoglycan-binding domain